MFGPDICNGLAEVKLVIRKEGAIYLDEWRKTLIIPVDNLPHLYRLTWRKNGTYDI